VRPWDGRLSGSGRSARLRSKSVSGSGRTVRLREERVSASGRRLRLARRAVRGSGRTVRLRGEVTVHGKVMRQQEAERGRGQKT
jgi:hypothetical protein